jgi:anti-sigma B factor antagonist
MPESPVVTIEETPEALVVHVQAESLDEERVRALQVAVRGAAEANPVQLCILDLARVGFLPSMSLATLIRLHSELHGRQQRLVLAAVQPRVRELIVMTRLDRLFELHEDVEHAMRAARGV